jgi:hypothetical protein
MTLSGRIDNQIIGKILIVAGVGVLTGLALTDHAPVDAGKHQRYEAAALTTELAALDGEVKDLMADYAEACGRAYEYSGQNFCKHWEPTR